MDPALVTFSFMVLIVMIVMSIYSIQKYTHLLYDEICKMNRKLDNLLEQNGKKKVE